jgi:hypothetical protein
MVVPDRCGPVTSITLYFESDLNKSYTLFSVTVRSFVSEGVIVVALLNYHLWIRWHKSIVRQMTVRQMSTGCLSGGFSGRSSHDPLWCKRCWSRRGSTAVKSYIINHSEARLSTTGVAAYPSPSP